jgi:hypothetical protein
MSKHTPGAWTRGRGAKHTVVGGPAGNHRGVCVISNGNGDEWEANANLIAAAPALLEALENAARAIEDELAAAGPDEVKQHPTLKRHEKALGAARRAIAQARGEVEAAPVLHSDKIPEVLTFHADCAADRAMTAPRQTPGPLEARLSGDRWLLYDPSGSSAAPFAKVYGPAADTEANARELVRRWNAHKALVEALGQVTRKGECTCLSEHREEDSCGNDPSCLVAIARRALAATKED